MRYHLDEFKTKCLLRLGLPGTVLSHKVINLSSYISDLQKVGVENYLLVFTDETGKKPGKSLLVFRK